MVVLFVFNSLLTRYFLKYCFKQKCFTILYDFFSVRLPILYPMLSTGVAQYMSCYPLLSTIICSACCNKWKTKEKCITWLTLLTPVHFSGIWALQFGVPVYHLIFFFSLYHSFCLTNLTLTLFRSRGEIANQVPVHRLTTLYSGVHSHCPSVTPRSSPSSCSCSPKLKVKSPEIVWLLPCHTAWRSGRTQTLKAPTSATAPRMHTMFLIQNFIR